MVLKEKEIMQLMALMFVFLLSDIVWVGDVCVIMRVGRRGVFVRTRVWKRQRLEEV